MFDQLPPELILCILDFLPCKKDLCACSLSCQRIWLIVLKILMRRIYCPVYANKPACSAFVRTFRDNDGNDNLREHKQLVRSAVRRLTIYTQHLSYSLSRAMPWWLYTPSHIDLPILRRILQLFPSLHTVDLTRIAISPPFSSRTVRHESRAFTGRSIQALHAHSVEVDDGAEYSFVRFIETLPDLTAVRLQTASSSVTPRAVPRKRATPPFRHLALDLACTPACLAASYFPALHLIPAYENLEQLQVWFLHPADVPLLLRLLHASRSTLNVVSLALMDHSYGT